MRRILSERNIVIVLFVMVLITFSLAQEDTKKMERSFSNATSGTAFLLIKNAKKSQNQDKVSILNTPESKIAE